MSLEWNFDLLVNARRLDCIPPQPQVADPEEVQLSVKLANSEELVRFGSIALMSTANIVVLVCSPGACMSAIANRCLNKAEREKCWSLRDAYWDCAALRLQELVDASLPWAKSEEFIRSRCAKQRQAYETACPSQWVALFDRKRGFELYKARRLEQDRHTED